MAGNITGTTAVTPSDASFAVTASPQQVFASKPYKWALIHNASVDPIGVSFTAKSGTAIGSGGTFTLAPGAFLQTPAQWPQSAGLWAISSLASGASTAVLVVTLWN